MSLTHTWIHTNYLPGFEVSSDQCLKLPNISTYIHSDGWMNIQMSNKRTHRLNRVVRPGLEISKQKPTRPMKDNWRMMQYLSGGRQWMVAYLSSNEVFCPAYACILHMHAIPIRTCMCAYIAYIYICMPMMNNRECHEQNHRHHKHPTNHHEQWPSLVHLPRYVCCSPAASNLEETAAALKLASRAAKALLWGSTINTAALMCLSFDVFFLQWR